jgi:hypothetical protein
MSRKRHEQWSYDKAFSRHRGLIDVGEQRVLSNKHVAVAGLGGSGGIELLTLIRLGIGRFTIADPDVFEASNLNRQAGATISTLGRPKVHVMAEMASEINPSVDVRTFHGGVANNNAEEFLVCRPLWLRFIATREPRSSPTAETTLAVSLPPSSRQGRLEHQCPGLAKAELNKPHWHRHGSWQRPC